MTKNKIPEGMFTFEHNGTTHWLAPGETKVRELPGRAYRDAYMDGDDGENRLKFALLELVDTSEGALDALYSMPGPEMFTVIREWETFKPSEEDASLGESSASSD
jgi:hypothetical protein